MLVPTSSTSVQPTSGRLWNLLKKNPKYWPNFAAVFMLVPSIAAFSVWHALQGPDVSLSKEDPEPWQKFSNKQAKIYSQIDHKHYQHPRPRFDSDSSFNVINF